MSKRKNEPAGANNANEANGKKRKEQDAKAAAKPYADATGNTAGTVEAEIKAESDKRRKARKKQHIRIHADRIENLDETAEKIKKEGEEAKATGYKSICRIYYRESRWNWLRKVVNWLTSWAYAPGKCCLPMRYVNRMEMKRNFVKTRVVTRCATMFLGKNRGKKEGLILQPVPVEYLNRMGVEHIEKKPLGWLHRFPYYADLNTYSAVEFMRCAGVNPLANKEVMMKLVELKGKESTGELAYYYKMVPVGRFVPMELKSLTPNPNTVANGDSFPFVGPEPHSVAPLKTPVAPVGEENNKPNGANEAYGSQEDGDAGN